MSAVRLRELALELRIIAAARLDAADARRAREAADELAAIAGALVAGGAVVGSYAVVPLSTTEARGVPIAPPLGGKHRRRVDEVVE